ncbi:2-hydroxyacid dehydrogenase [Rhodococcus opacus]|uniref:2-hydroxyacid dehydrogenase n=1 Tax=Rhodococcus opacus TaxID=37919 RepID=UPI0007CD45F7|nr:2-hydroxyacid dehydrogenase [Rhodococcus opacus]MDX5968448.1 2-hydroxyacid dehydrogenase [Rhodococcus opacus]NKY75442.1 2-hydroxyacid dehydrogenase [Rhodococcus opacus]CAG7589168.1 2-ketogluconate reductase [Rhodococcus opacus]
MVTAESSVKEAAVQTVSEGRVLKVGPLKPSLTATLTEKYDALDLPVGDDRTRFLAEHGESVTAVVTSGRTGVDAALMTELPNLGAIVHFGVGYDTTDVVLAEELGIGVSNTPDVLTDCVADTAVGLLIDTLRGFSAADRFVRDGRWPAEGNFPLTRQVSGTRVGIVGLGRIGSAIATRLTGFGCTISYHNRREVPGSPFAYVGSAAALAAGVDVLIVAAAGGKGTEKLVDREVLEALGPDGYLINVARGSVVDEDALVELLTDRKLAGAGLDVFAREPHVPEALLALDTVVLLPHVASGTTETRAAMEALTLQNLDEYLAQGTLTTPVLEPRSR